MVRRRRQRNKDPKPHVSRDGDYDVFEKWREARSGATHGCARIVMNHGLYDRRGNEISLDEVERTVI
jgi:hypothetical protein